MALCKIVYLPLVGLILLLPKEKYKTKKEQVITNITIIGISLIANLTWLGIASSYLVAYKDGAPSVKLVNLFSNPIEFIERLFASINIYLREYIGQLFGKGVGADLHIQLYSVIPIVMFILFLFEAVSDNKIKEKLTIYQKIIILLIVLAISGLIFTSLYIQWSPINFPYILGVQGRYFLPILPLIGLLIGNSNKIKSEYDENKHNKFLRNSINDDIYVYNFSCCNR
ncbi:MAG: DUF2142 domain-containing protein [Clostridia bacterium]|nr:DUF2142 domain-containing protein [Clostridia bacterium]